MRRSQDTHIPTGSILRLHFDSFVPVFHQICLDNLLENLVALFRLHKALDYGLKTRRLGSSHRRRAGLGAVAAACVGGAGVRWPSLGSCA